MPFRAAGDALGAPRTTVSRRVAELESALGTRLFHRTTRHVDLTSVGKTYLRACGPALRTIIEAGRALATRSEDTAGRLRVTAPVTLAETLLGEGDGTFRSRGRSVEVPVRGRFVVNSIPLAIEAAARGLGVARFAGAGVIEGLGADRLVEVLDAYAPPARPLYAVHASGGRVSPAARAFLEIAKSHLERRLAGQAAATRD